MHANDTKRSYQKRSEVLKFGNWENADVPYTDYSEKARISKSAKTISNKTSGGLDRSSNNLSIVQAPPVKSGSQKGEEAVRKKHVHGSSPEDGNLRRPSGSLPQHDPANRKVASGLPIHSSDRSAISNDSPKKAIQQSVRSDSRIEHSPLPQNHQTRVGGKGSGKSRPSLPRKSSTEGSNNLAPSTPGRPRMRPVTQGNDIRDHSAAVPKFGDWDESNPASADGFTDTFNKVREEKLNGNGMVSIGITQEQHKETPMRCWCFPWCK